MFRIYDMVAGCLRHVFYTGLMAQGGKPPGIVPAKYIELPLASVRPKGWLLQQLQIMNNGTTGHLDEVYDKIKIDNGWLGGTGDEVGRNTILARRCIAIGLFARQCCFKE